MAELMETKQESANRVSNVALRRSRELVTMVVAFPIVRRNATVRQ